VSGRRESRSYHQSKEGKEATPEQNARVSSWNPGEYEGRHSGGAFGGEQAF